VLDEAHTYAGAFGAHVGMVLRRLVRICVQLEVRPQFICCSATIANPAEHARKLIPFAAMQAIAGLEDVRVVDVDTSPLGRRTLALWNPPLRQNQGQAHVQHQYESEDACTEGSKAQHDSICDITPPPSLSSPFAVDVASGDSGKAASTDRELTMLDVSDSVRAFLKGESYSFAIHVRSFARVN
jgi:hypothetical protein